jgi:hypothetical protein
MSEDLTCSRRLNVSAIGTAQKLDQHPDALGALLLLPEVRRLIALVARGF